VTEATQAAELARNQAEAVAHRIPQRGYIAHLRSPSLLGRG